MTSNKAAAIGAGYFAAWSAGNVDRATEYLTDDVEIIAPNGRFSGHPGYHEFMDGFVRMLTGVTEFTIFGDDTTALIWYDTHLQPVPSLPGIRREGARARHHRRVSPVLTAADPGYRHAGTRDAAMPAQRRHPVVPAGTRRARTTVPVPAHYRRTGSHHHGVST